MNLTAAELGIPALDLAGCATHLPLPVTKWGAQARYKRMPGTYHFYGHDYTFTGLLRDPDLLVRSGCKAAVEPNFSAHSAMSVVETLMQIHRKRTLAQAWIREGVKIVVDLNVELELLDLALLGVPDGWHAFATRVHREDSPLALLQVFRRAQEVSHRLRPLFMVYGGGKRYRDLSAANGWEWVPEHRQVVQGKVPAYGQIG